MQSFRTSSRFVGKSTIFRLVIASIASIAAVLALGCIVPEELVQYEEVAATQNSCPTITNALPEKNLITSVVGDSISFIVNAEDSDGDDIEISFWLGEEELINYASEKVINFFFAYTVRIQDFESTNFIEVRAEIRANPDEDCPPRLIDWTIFLPEG